MENVYVFGHRRPDTDSICAAIARANLINKTSKFKAIPCALSAINNESKYVLERFGVETPKYLNDVKVQIRDLSYHKKYYVDKKESIKNAYDYMNNISSSGIPLVDKKNNNKLLGLITLKGIAREVIESDRHHLNTSYNNILDTINGEEILKFDDEIEGNILAATYKSTTFLNDVNLQSDSILVIGDRHSILEYAVESGVKLIILIGNSKIRDEHLEIAKKNRVNIISTGLGSFEVSSLLILSNYAETINEVSNPVTFKDSDYLSDFHIVAKREKHTNYPVINNKGECLGLIEYTRSEELSRKKVVLVDHNEKEQSCEGIEEAQIIEIIDHHKLGTIATNSPINFRNMSVGSTCTIIYNLYKERGVEFDDKIAGLLLSAIISDTLLLKSPTTTSVDVDVVSSLSNRLGINYYNYGLEMFKAGSSLDGLEADEVIHQDFKKFTFENINIGIGQIFVTNYEEISKNMDIYISELNKMEKNENYGVACLFITDIIRNGSYVLYNTNSSDIIKEAFNIDIYEGIFLEGIVSRKKQVISSIIEVLKKSKD